MNTSYFVARRIIKNSSASFSKFIIKLATIATALSVSIMILAVAVVFGFKETIKDKMFVFWGHIQIAPYNPNPTSIISPNPFLFDAGLSKKIESVSGVISVHPYLVKPTIIQTEELMEGIKLKGVDSSFPFHSNQAITFKGESIKFPAGNYAQELLLSETVLNRLDKQIGDSVLLYFINPDAEFPRVRKVKITGSYHTGMEEIDRNFAYCDMKLLQRISNWNENAIHGYQVSVSDYQNADEIAENIYQEYLDPPMNKITINEIYPNIFSWLELMNTNAYIILIIMAIVAVINISTALLIFILERTNMIGILKTLGMPLVEIQRIFIFHAGIVTLKGIIWGIIFGVGISLLQQYTHIISLDETAYYMQYAPIRLVWWHVLLIIVGTLLFSMIMMIIPSLIIKRLSIIRAIRFN